MTQPSVMLDAIVSRLAARLQPSLVAPATPNITVRQVDDTATVDLSEYMTVQSPGVYVTCLSAPELGRDVGPLTVEAQWMARCYARLGLPPAEAGKPGSSRGDVAMNLAALVASIVDEEMWLGLDAKPTAHRAAQRVTLTNRGSRDLATRSLSLWIVTWTQPLELTAPDLTGILHSFRKLNTTITTTGDEQLLELEGEAP